MSSGELADATIVFDLDGTLVDSAPDLLTALNATLDLEGLRRVKLEAVRGLIGQGARVMIDRAAAASGASFSGERLDQLTNAFVEFYRANIAVQSRPYPGVGPALDALAGLGAKLAVCTNKRSELSLRLLDALDLSRRFSAIVGADAVTQRKPHPDHYRAAVSRAGGGLRRSLMVGDTATDVATARGAGAPVIVVRFGYSDIGAEGLGADAIIDHFRDLTQVSRRLMAARA